MNFGVLVDAFSSSERKWQQNTVGKLLLIAAFHLAQWFSKKCWISTDRNVRAVIAVAYSSYYEMHPSLVSIFRNLSSPSSSSSSSSLLTCCCTVSLKICRNDGEEFFFRLCLAEIHDEVRRVVVLGTRVPQPVEVAHDLIHSTLVKDAALFHIDTPTRCN